MCVSYSKNLYMRCFLNPEGDKWYRVALPDVGKQLASFSTSRIQGTDLRPCPSISALSPSPPIPEQRLLAMLSRQAISAALRSSAPRSAIGRTATAIPHIRSYAQPASSPDTKPPVAVYGLDGTYASALVSPYYPSSLQKPRFESSEPSMLSVLLKTKS